MAAAGDADDPARRVLDHIADERVAAAPAVWVLQLLRPDASAQVCHNIVRRKCGSARLKRVKLPSHPGSAAPVISTARQLDLVINAIGASAEERATFEASAGARIRQALVAAAERRRGEGGARTDGAAAEEEGPVPEAAAGLPGGGDDVAGAAAATEREVQAPPQHVPEAAAQGDAARTPAAAAPVRRSTRVAALAAQQEEARQQAAAAVASATQARVQQAARNAAVAAPRRTRRTVAAVEAAAAAADAAGAKEQLHPDGLWAESWTGVTAAGGRGAGITVHQAKWQQRLKRLSFRGLLVCALCGLAAFAIDRKIFTLMAPPSPTAVPPTKLFNGLNGGIMFEGDSWLVCKMCAVGGERAAARHAANVFFAPDYLRELVALDPFFAMQLSLVDVGVGFAAHVSGYMRLTHTEPHAMAAALVARMPSEPLRARLAPDSFKRLLSWGVRFNPLLQKYLTVAEQGKPAGVEPFLAAATVAGFLAAATTRGPLALATAENDAVARSNLAVVLPQLPIVRGRGAFPTKGTVYTVGTLHLRHGCIAAVANLVDAVGAAVHEGLSMEECIFPTLFPLGYGAFQAAHKWLLSDYAQLRARSLLSAWTLVKPYILLLHAHVVSLRLQTSGRAAVLERAVAEYKASHPFAADSEVLRHVLKFHLPSNLPGTPAWHRRHLQDLLCMVDKWGMPTHFLTLTADEVSATRWPDMAALEEMLYNYDYGMTFRDAPCEAAYLFHKRCQTFMKDVLKCNSSKTPGPLGRIDHHVLRYEVQGRGSLHAHVILWINPADVERVSSEIIACVPAEYLGNASDPRCPDSSNYWRVPDDPAKAALLVHVLSKQMHICRSPGCLNDKHLCRYDFPFAPHTSATPCLDRRGLKYVYYRPSWAHRNVVPYHPTVALAWGAHMNLQRITSSSWSFYVLKYAMKCEPAGNLRLTPASRVLLGMPEEAAAAADDRPTSSSPAYLARLISGYVSSTVADPALAFLSCAQIPLISRSDTVAFIDACPPHTRQRLVLPGAKLAVAPITVYTLRPAELADVTFTDFFLNHVVVPTSAARQGGKGRTLVGPTQDGALNVFRLNEPRLLRFTDPSPDHDAEAFFYVHLLRSVPFSSEEELLSPNNASHTYYEECVLRELLATEDDLADLLERYGTYHLFDTTRRDALLANLMAVYIPDEDEEAASGGGGGGSGAHDGAADGDSDSDSDGGGDAAAPTAASDGATPVAAAPDAPATPAANPARPLQLPRPQRQPAARPRAARAQPSAQVLLGEFAELDDTPCTPAQAAVLQAIAGMSCGLVVLSGGPGAGKSFVTKKLTRCLRLAGRQVLLSATTGAAATRLSRHATTNHSTYGLPRNGAWQPWQASDVRAEPLRNCDTLVLEEFSMMGHINLLHILLRLQESNGYDSPEEVLANKLIVLVGDHAQLPPVCRCKAGPRQRAAGTQGEEEEGSGGDACMQCHLSVSPFWPRAVKFHLPASVRHAKDPDFAAFLDLIRTRRPTQREIDAVFGTREAPVAVTYIAPDDVAALATADTTVLCTHFNDALRHNNAIVRKLAAEAGQDVWPCVMEHNVTNRKHLKDLAATFLAAPKFHKMQLVAVGARVIVTANVNIRAGLANGATGTVVHLELGPAPALVGEGVRQVVTAVHVRLDSAPSRVHVIKRTLDACHYYEGCTYRKATFPLTLGYAITAHRSQGATLAGRTIIHAHSVFAPGQLYVMLSRVTERRLISLAGTLTPDMFQPVTVPGLGTGGMTAAAPSAAGAAPSVHAGPSLEEIARVAAAAVQARAEAAALCCEACRSPRHAAALLLCEDCGKGWHRQCLQVPLRTIPSGPWRCMPCAQAARRRAAQGLFDVDASAAFEDMEDA